MPKKRRKKDSGDTGSTDAADEFDTETTDASEAEPETTDAAETLNEELDPPVPAPASKTSPEPGLPRIPLRVFEKIAGPKWDQLAGFKHYAKRNNLGPMTVPEWREALQQFKTKPTK